jgi:putative tricarboxylic transport membrane protein
MSIMLKAGRWSGRLAAAALAVLTVAYPLGAQALDEVKIIAPAAPGGGWDQTARTMAEAMQSAGVVKNVQVSNVPGAGGTIGLAQFADAQKGKGDSLMVTGLVMVGAILTNNSPVSLADTTPMARLTGEYEIGRSVPAASQAALVLAFVPPARHALFGSGGRTGTWYRAVGNDASGPWHEPHAESAWGPATWSQGTGLPSAPRSSVPFTPQGAPAEPVKDT